MFFLPSPTISSFLLWICVVKLNKFLVECTCRDVVLVFLCVQMKFNENAVTKSDTTNSSPLALGDVLSNEGRWTSRIFLWHLMSMKPLVICNGNHNLAPSSPLLYVNSQSYRYPFRVSSRLCFLSPFNIYYGSNSNTQHYLRNRQHHQILPCKRFSSWSLFLPIIKSILISRGRSDIVRCGNRRFSSFDYLLTEFFQSSSLSVLVHVLVPTTTATHTKEHESKRANQHKLCKRCKQKHETKNIKRWCMIIIMIYMRIRLFTRAPRIKALYFLVLRGFFTPSKHPISGPIVPYYH